MNNMRSPTQPKQPHKRLNIVLIKTEFCQNVSVRVLLSNYLNVRMPEGNASSSPCLITLCPVLSVCVCVRPDRETAIMSKYYDGVEFPFCDEFSKYEKLAKIGQGTFG